MEVFIMKLKVMTYNIAGGRDYSIEPWGKNHNPDACIDVIRSIAPDICGLNEVDYELPRSKNIKMAKYIGDKLGYYSVFAPAIAWAPGLYGNGFISRFPIVSAITIPVPDPVDRSEPVYYETRCILRATIDVGGRYIDVFVTHFGLAKTERANSIKLLLRFIKAAKNPVILMGDFNVQPDNPEMEPLMSAMQNTGDVLPAGTYSFPSHGGFLEKQRDGSYKPYPKLLIDYIMTTPEFTASEQTVHEVRASDHKPYSTVLTF